MTIGEKISNNRKALGYTQETLAEKLNVSRQSVSRWESNLAYPETDKLIVLSKLFNTSIDYLLNDDFDNPNTNSTNHTTKKINHYTYLSKQKLGNLPLIHINLGFNQKAEGIIAIGFRAKGIISIGFLSFGLISFGLLSFGLISFGLLSIALLLSLGVFSIGAISIGTIALGVLSLGAIAIGNFSFGALAIGQYLAIGDVAYGDIAVGFSKAIGNTLSYQTLSETNLNHMSNHLDQVLPEYLKFIKDFIWMFLK